MNKLEQRHSQRSKKPQTYQKRPNKSSDCNTHTHTLIVQEPGSMWGDDISEIQRKGGQHEERGSLKPLLRGPQLMLFGKMATVNMYLQPS